MVSRPPRKDRHKVAAVKMGILAVIVVACSVICAAQKPRDYSHITITVDSPSFMECVYCESFHRHSQMLKRQYPGIQIKERKWTEAQTKAAGIKGFPRIWVCKRLDGFGTDDRKELQRLLQ